MLDSKKERLESQVESWQESVDYDRHPLRLSTIVFGLGTFLDGAGAIATVAGLPEVGIPALLLGTEMAIIGAMEMRSDLNGLIKVAGTTAIRRYQSEQVSAK